MRRPRPGPRQLSQAEETLRWLRWLEVEDARVLWLRANGAAQKAICWQMGFSRATADRRYRYGLAVIVWWLNGKRPPAERSMTYK